jgi:ABC-type polysaccharide transport system permease subunit
MIENLIEIFRENFKKINLLKNTSLVLIIIILLAFLLIICLAYLNEAEKTDVYKRVVDECFRWT